ncbi:uncharacterized protein BX663DRAFT_518634 [Cokeromyces recurvatus]|uniref:uncharacterized protein n=1 Tax=Cokeromyces recurvatus TaxID=90255 RepID=UPI00221EEBCB|nr:uncharacterized protein BX663DRAFT_518634 [Cokeromyces recurvatus]KAI7900117.1 hypothetical protein BX663DRAFT_518634 [Cokeromyces recurvatus]
MNEPMTESIVSSSVDLEKSSSRKSNDHQHSPFRCSLEVDLEDGPLFRATLKEYEGKTSTLRHQLKQILKAATASFDAKCLVLEEDKRFMETLREASFSEPLFTHYLDHIWDKLNEQQERLTFCMQNLLISPLQKLYDFDIKTAEAKRRQFEDVSKEYYSNLSKYLSIKTTSSNSVIEKRKLKAESEFMLKKRHFDIVRFEYYSFLQDLHGEPYKFGLEEIANKVVEASKEQKVVSQERDEKRKILISKYISSPTITENTSVTLNKTLERKNSFHGRHSISTDIALSPPPPPPLLNENDISPLEGLDANKSRTSKFKGIRDMEQQNHRLAATMGHKKEGFLFAPSKPSRNMNSFDVSSNIHWHNILEPINLRFATIREARDAERRFCFEVITPKFRRMYQATSNEELSEWLATINNAIIDLLNGSASALDLCNEKMTKKSISSSWLQSRSLSGALSGLAAAKEKYLKKKKKRNMKNNSNYNYNYNKSTPSSSQNPTNLTLEKEKEEGLKLLKELRKDESNMICADCSAKSPEWCSLNLGILLCIECSGIHRSLGTHISKVRSLILDSSSFTPEIVQVLMSMGNRKANEIWESELLSNEHITSMNIKKPIPSDSRETKLKFIQAKYIERAFVKCKNDRSIDSMNLLYTAIENNDIPQAMHAIALGADVNKPFFQNDHNNRSIIPLVDLNKEEEREILEIPYLDRHGNQISKNNIIVTCPLQYPPLEQAYKNKFIVRYALHLALISRHHSIMEYCSELSDEEIISSDENKYTIHQMKDTTIDNRLKNEPQEVISSPPNKHHSRYQSCSSYHSSSSSSSSSSSEGSSQSVNSRNSSIYSLSEEVAQPRQFIMAEFLLQNGADVSIVDCYTGHHLAVLIGLGDLVDDEALDYLNAKNSLRGQAAIQRTQVIPQPITTGK